jgi:Flp pilus assembly protein TadD
MMSDVDSVLQQALALGEEGRWEEMAQLLSQELEVEPDDPYLLCWSAVAERELGNESLAYDLFKRCLAQNPLDAHLLAIAGSGLAAFDDPEAEAALRAAALTEPDLAMARVQYGAYLARAGFFEEALENLRAGVNLTPEDPVAHGELGVALALKGDMAGAARAMEDALDLAPDDSWTRVLLGLVYLEQEDHEHGAETLLAAAQERPDDAEAQILAALAAASAGWAETAEQVLARAEYSAQGADTQLLEEASERIAAGADAARSMLHDDIAPAVLHERLLQPL